MLIPAVAAILDRDLRGLQRELEAYASDAQVWQEVPGLPNAAGTLALHLTGNLQHFIGARLGNTGYVRDRPAEFSRRNVARAELASEIAAARAAIARTLATLSEAQLDEPYPDLVGGVRLRLGDYLVHLVSHFTYHLGQIDYHRRVVTGQSAGVDVVRPGDLASARVPS